jgi:Ni,Fe-hydrogenase maturation factor
MCLHQLGPELAETLSEYDVVVFIDAHVEAAQWDHVHWQQIEPNYGGSMVSHHLKPQAVLALCGSLYERCPTGYTLSILGTDFDFGMTLSDTTADLVDESVERLLELIDREHVDVDTGASPA